MDLTQQLINLHEGRRSKQYLDSLGIPTIGIGHNLKASAPCQDVVKLQTFAGLPIDDDWTDDSINAQYRVDLNANCAWLWVKPWWSNLSEPRQAALNDMGFNLGPETFQKFGTFLGLIAGGDYDAAALDLLKTAVYHELPKRYGELETIIRTGSTAGIL